MPGVLLVIPLWLLREPERGGSEEKVLRDVCQSKIGYSSLFANRPFITNTLAMTAMTFAMGGLSQWVPTFLYRIHKHDLAQANTHFDCITVLAGVAGTLLGGWVGDFFQSNMNDAIT